MGMQFAHDLTAVYCADCRLLCNHATGHMEFTAQGTMNSIVHTAVWHHAGRSYLCDHLQAFLSPSRAL